jgi:hypothetical protein
MKSCNEDRGKGVAGMRVDIRDTSARHGTGEWVETKLVSITQRAREDPKFEFTSLAHLLTEDFLKGCFWELKRDKASGIDGVSVEEYEADLEKEPQGFSGKVEVKEVYATTSQTGLHTEK